MSYLLEQFTFKSLVTLVESGPFGIKENAKTGRTKSVLISDILKLNSLF